MPAEIVFACDEAAADGGGDPAPSAARLGTPPARVLLSHFEFVQHGGRQFEYRTKDTVATGGGSVAAVIDTNTGADVQADLGAQTLTAVSVRALQTMIMYAKAMAWFRGDQEVRIDDVAAVLPFVLRGKLRPNPTHPRFETGIDVELVTDTASWLADLFAESRRQFNALGLGADDPVGALLATPPAGWTACARRTRHGGSP